ncbi:3-isopropylmalate dehydratase [Candidatus Woesearchaeota archaeon]|jgi:3-isopropylmalate/(R)-2-methylmalate dehydratase small subunit|nr:3-isopropylmalate dehydratase [Candidatus Woesearchaeota archaeon]|tara:strand:- start:3137 stop:3640 length:504 start_codon:yes stop_codon:yes gene_type:complete
MAKVWKTGDDVNTDEIIPCKYYPRPKIEELGDFCLHDVYPEFAKNRKKGDVLVAGDNFGCGSSREYAPVALKYSGIKCIIAKSFARIFYRNAINIGLPILISKDAYDNFEEGDEIEVDLEKGVIKNISKNLSFKTEPLPKFVMKIVDEGGIVEFLKKHDFKELQEVK